ncbi:hypothetical protein, conserved [Trypanosoma brucei gambiense DAL972]|uniref:Leucine-rich repeat protein (LRRP) n=1 Tax=Trypanosoma brucei gambiense (strain MHOM/CI/86/DAL972) TaxID=679716 RepID=D0A163_TRYB9|nr:hypothetical protein, conserved [Trypanosoma brucei gambiense DAL972]CBH15005.1 hypothetical protein, conserved [Trypanosoma brucei gambiense DAL972]|eukprot:XP_011777271.1 hypothetical protein, conserved [Trypanosoma brucei gambiense DAL972]
MESPVEMYRSHCQAVGVAMNSALLRGLPETTEKLRNMKVMHFGRNFLGDRGILPLLPVIKQAKSLHTLDLRNNGIGNEGVKALCRQLRDHPSLRVLELGGNPFTYLAARQLTYLCEYNDRITFIGVDDTLMTEPLRQSIVHRMQATMKRRENRRQRKQASPNVIDNEENTTEEVTATGDTEYIDDAAVAMGVFVSEDPLATPLQPVEVVTEACVQLISPPANTPSVKSEKVAEMTGDEMISGPSPSSSSVTPPSTGAAASSTSDSRETTQANEDEVGEAAEVFSDEEQNKVATVEETDETSDVSVHSAGEELSGSMVDDDVQSESSVTRSDATEPQEDSIVEDED